MLSVAVGSQGAVYAGTPRGVFKSTNNGGTWTSSNFGNPGSAGVVVVDPVTPSNVYLAPNVGDGSFGNVPASALVEKSTNGGAAWLASGNFSGAGALVIDPTHPAILYAGNTTGVFRSSDGGGSWIQTSFPYACFSLVIDPVTPTTVYGYAYELNTGAQGIHKSIDSGTTWTPISSGLPSQTINGLFVTPDAVFAFAGGQCYRSADGGAQRGRTSLRFLRGSWCTRRRPCTACTSPA